MIPKNKKEPDKIICVGGREFHLYKEYSDISETEILNYPDFAGNPEYTDEGRPFALRAQGSCPNGKTDRPDDPAPYICGECVFFYREHTPYDPIGICMNDVLRCESNKEK